MRLRRKRNRRVVLALADMHAGHRLGLLRPDVILVRDNDLGEAEEWSPELGETQKWLWDCYIEAIQSAVSLAGDDEIIVIHCGDATNGDIGTNIFGLTRSDQRTIAAQNLLLVARLPQVKKVRLVTGTEVHVPDCAEAQIATVLSGKTGKDIKAAHHSRATVDGVAFDLAHHGPHPGTRDWLKGNVALYYLKSAVYEARRAGQEPARVYLRAHYHDFVPVPYQEVWQDEIYHYDLCIVPSFCGMTRYARKVTRSVSQLTVGMVAFVVEDGRLGEIRPFLNRLDLRAEEVL